MTLVEIAHYRIINKLGEGGMGEVWLAEDTRLDRKVALKLLPEQFTRDEERVRRFVQEAKAASALNHPNIITIHEIGQTESRHYIAAEFIEGETLRQKLSRGPLTINETIEVAIQVAGALVAAHKAGVIHRDVKPENVMVRRDGIVKVLDFGLAKLIELRITDCSPFQRPIEEDDASLQSPPANPRSSTRRGRNPQLTHPGVMLGTPHYMSPEQARGQEIDARSDIFSLGVLLYEMVAGQAPFAGVNALEVISEILKSEPAPLSARASNLSDVPPAKLQHLISRALRKNRDDRYMAASELLADLKELKRDLDFIAEERRRSSSVGSAATGSERGLAWSEASGLQPTPSESGAGSAAVDIAHVLFCDIVGYSILPIDRQKQMISALQEIVRQTEDYRRADLRDQLVRLPAGDGMALAFLQDPVAPVRCAFEIARALQSYPEIGLRMGIHSGPVFLSTDINGTRNVVGSGINMAQRVMDSGDAGHILVSRNMAEVLGQISHWQLLLHDLGEREVKHGVRIHLYNVYTDEIGNAARPTKLQPAPSPPEISENADRRAADADATPGEIRSEGGGDLGLAAKPAVERHTVGREKERAELRAGVDSALNGRGQLLCVAGEPGIGKTTLVEDFLASLAAGGQCAIARGRCSERLAGTEAYLPLLEAIEGLLQRGSNPAMSRALKQIAPTWRAQVAPLPGDSGESASLLAEVRAVSQERMKRELGAFLQEVGRLRPLVLFIDDLQWADVSTIDMLSFLAGKFDALNALIVVTYRPSDMLLSKHPFLQIKPDLQARGVCRELKLEFLNEAEIAEYLALEFPDHRFPPGMPALIHAKTEGNPLFMADLAHYLRDRGVNATESGRWELGQPLPDLERELPESVRGMIERKIAQLDEEDRKLLAAASVQGYEFDSAVVAQILNLDANEVEERLEKLERVYGFVKLTSETEFPDRTLTLRYRFVHALYQNALYGSLRITRKASLSAAVAEALEGFYGAQSANVVNELAVLWETAREYAKAAECFRLAAQQASQIFATQEAATLARRGLALLQRLPDTPERNERELPLQIILGNALIALKGHASLEFEESFLRARELCRQIGETPYLLPTLYGLTTVQLLRAKLRRALELGEELLSQAQQRQDPAVIVAHRSVAMPLYSLGEFTQAREHLERIGSLYSSERHRYLTWLYGQEPGMAGRLYLAMTLWVLGYPEQAQAQREEAIRLSREVAHVNSQAYCLYGVAGIHLNRREWAQAREMSEALVALATEQGLALALAWGKTLLGRVMAEEGRTAQGIDQLRRGQQAFLSTGAELWQPWFRFLLAESYQKAGQPHEALAEVNEALTAVEKNEERSAEADLYRLRGELLLTTGAAATEAESCFHKAIEVTQNQSAKSLELRATTSLARLWRRQGRSAEAQRMLAEIYGWFTEGLDTPDLKDAKALLDELQLDPLREDPRFQELLS
jgi:serine/threonine protein kinase/tetratricopeptide (TPR) repeat protein